MAFARIFSGSLHKGQQLYVLGPKHDPSKALTEVCAKNSLCHLLISPISLL